MLKKVVPLLFTALLFADGPVFKTGQTTVYRTGDDGTYQAGTAHSYTRDNANGIVTDSASGLQWQDNAIGATMTWAAAGTYCTDLNLDGTGWRLPSIEELKSIVDYADTVSPIIASVFQNTASGSYWSSTTYASNPDGAWYVYFNYGYDNANGKTGSNYVRCVRSGQPL